MYWTPPLQTIGPPLLESDDLFLGNQEILDPPFQKSWTRPWFMHNKYNDIKIYTLSAVLLKCESESQFQYQGQGQGQG